MPEGDSIYRAARRLDAALSNRSLQSSDFRLPSYATLNLASQTVSSVISRGKHLLIRVADLSIHTHLSMDGHWDVYATGERWRAPAFKARCVLRNPDFQAVGFDLGFLRVIRTVDEPDAVGHLGPDPLGASWDAEEVHRRLAMMPERPIALTLLDQRVIAGLGNIYRSELLFLLGLHPRTPTGQLPDPVYLVDLAHQLMHANKDRSRRVTTTPPMRDQYWVYGRAGKPCLRCGDTVEHRKLGQPRPPAGARRGADRVPAGRRGPAAGGPRPADSTGQVKTDEHQRAPGAEPCERGIDLNERDLYFCPSCQVDPFA
ncbi:MAG: Fpg/Nei family DNA glycosylase [Micrococcaceae bacterium]|nr:Fpg/Nei family DNA glycosylase [Micrococcaceae bacterium]